MKYKNVILGDYVSSIKGYVFKSKDMSRSNHVPVIKVSNFKDYDISLEGVEKLPVDFLKIYKKFLLSEGDILISTVGSWPSNPKSVVGKVVKINFAEPATLLNQNIVKITSSSDALDNRFLFWLLKNNDFKDYIISNAQGSANQASITLKSIQNYKFKLPILLLQIEIANFLDSIQKKIELNNQIISTLEELASTLFKRWFVDFEFPDENGNPYKSSGGKMIDSELGEIPVGWRKDVIGNVMENFDRKRVPVSKMERVKRTGKFPYYGAASLMDYIDDFLFDGTYLLLGEDGTVINDEGGPVLQYVCGKFWVNNHAHVLRGRDFISTEWLYLWFMQTKVSSIITGAVQPKISQKNMNGLNVVVPDREVLKKFDNISKPLFQKRINILKEKDTLESVRDLLLSKLLSGEIEIPQGEEV